VSGELLEMLLFAAICLAAVSPDPLFLQQLYQRHFDNLCCPHCPSDCVDKCIDGRLSVVVSLTPLSELVHGERKTQDAG